MVSAEQTELSFRAVRLKFKKTGAARFISHLDLNRTFKNVIMRAGIRVAYSHGFNPRPKLVFSLPLSIGTGSICEFLDLQIAGDFEYDELMRLFYDNLPPDIQVLGCYEPHADFKKIAWAEYDIVLKYDGICSEDCERITSLFSSPVIITKRTKATQSGFRDFDIAPYVRIRECIYINGEIRMNALLASSNETYVNPEFLTQAYDKYLNIKFTDPMNDEYSVLRKQVYLDDGVTVFE